MKRNYLIILMVLLNANLFSQKFAVIGDFRYSATCDTLNASGLVKSWDPEFIVTTGDLSDPTCNAIDHEIGKYFSDYIYPYYGAYGSTATYNRFIAALGNHDQYLTGLELYLEYFTFPGNERYYDTLIGNVHIFILNSSGDEPDGPFYYQTQGLWLQSAMAASTAPWKLIFFHHPPYTSGTHGNSTWMQWPFAEWGATAVFNGHDHDYEKLFVNGVYYFVNGIGGADLRSFTSVNEYSLKRVSGIHGAVLCNAYQDSLVIECISLNDSLLDRQLILPLSSSGTTENNDIFLFPNPVTNELYISFTTKNISEIHITINDNQGKEIGCYPYTPTVEGSNMAKIDTSELMQGLYHVNVHTGMGVFSRKFIKY